jgi:lambda family phage tail tape measure protein
MRNSVKNLAKDGTIKEWARDAALGAAFVVDAFDGVARAVQIVGRWIGVSAAQVMLLAKGEFKAASNAGLEFGKDMDTILQKTLFSDTLKAKFAQSDVGAGSTLAAKSLNYSNKNGPMATTGADPGKAFIEQLQRQLQQQEKGRFEMLRMEAAQKGVSAAAAPYIYQLEEIQNRQERIKDTIAAVAESEKQRAKSLSLVTSGNDQAGAIIRETAMLGMQADARRKMIELRKVDAMVEQLSTDATIEQRIELQKLADTMKNNVAAAIDADIKKQEELNASWQVGAHDALTDYMKNVMDVAGQTKSAVTSAFKGMEDALVSFVKTGKLDFSSLADSIITDMIRMMVQKSIMQPLAAGFDTGGFGGMLSAGAKLLGFANGGDPPVGVPSIVGEHGPELFVPRAAGTIVPNGMGLANQAPAVTVVQNFTVGDVASISMVRQAVSTSQRQIVAAFARSQNYGGAIA